MKVYCVLDDLIGERGNILIAIHLREREAEEHARAVKKAGGRKPWVEEWDVADAGNEQVLPFAYVESEERLKGIAIQLNGIANAMASAQLTGPNVEQMMYWRECVERAYDLARGISRPAGTPGDSSSGGDVD